MPATTRVTRKQPRRQQAQPTTAVEKDRRHDALMDFRARRVARQLNELERTNNQDLPPTSFALSNLATLPSSTASASTSNPTDPNSALALALLAAEDAAGPGGKKSKKKQTANVRSLLMYKKGLGEWLDELPEDHPYLTCTSPPSLYPPRKICSSCGYHGAYPCDRCGEYSCSKKCVDVHVAEGGCGVGN